MSSMSSVENSKGNSSHGGARPNAGRPKGSMNEETKEKKRVKAAIVERINKNADRLFNAQMSLAEGTSFLYRQDKDDKGKKLPAVQVTDPGEIKAFIDGEHQDDKSSYYYIATERPDNRSIDSMFDRSFGKPQQSIDHTSGDKPLPILGGITLVRADDSTEEDSPDQKPTE